MFCFLTNNIMRNILITLTIFHLLVSSILIASPLNDFLNPEKKKLTTSSSKKDKSSYTLADSSQKTVLKKIQKERTESTNVGPDQSEDKASPKKSAVKNRKEPDSKWENLDISKNSKKKNTKTRFQPLKKILHLLLVIRFRESNPFPEAGFPFFVITT